VDETLLAIGHRLRELAKWQLFGFESDPEGQFRIHLGKIEQPSEFVLNYAIIKPEGCVRAEVVTEGGVKVYAFEDSVPLTRAASAKR